MLRLKRCDDIFSLDVDMLVNPVNALGVANKGLALEFKRRFPSNFRIYSRACLGTHFEGSRVLIVPPHGNHRFYIANVAVRDSWRDALTIIAIREGLRELTSWLIGSYNVRSVGIPLHGCEPTKLQWKDVLSELRLFSVENSGVETVVLVPSS